jgi:hypothetical protein
MVAAHSFSAGVPRAGRRTPSTGRAGGSGVRGRTSDASARRGAQRNQPGRRLGEDLVALAEGEADE